MTPKRIKVNLFSERSIQHAIDAINNYVNEMNTVAVNTFVEKLCQKGVGIAQAHILQMDAIETGELFESIHVEQGSPIWQGAQYIIKTDCEWACYVEFGTGIIGEQSPHDLANSKGYEYDVNSHGVDGWVYYKDGAFHWTCGYAPQPFMYETSLDLRYGDVIVKTAREVFRNVRFRS